MEAPPLKDASSGTPQCRILFVDDNPDRIRSDVVLGIGDRAQHWVLHPNDVTLTDLEKADLVLVDFVLEDWDERDSEQSLSLKPSNGIALAVLLREHVDSSTKNRLTAFALHTGHLDDLRGRLRSANAEHVIARLNNLEWAYSKTSRRRHVQMVILADAVRHLPKHWPDDAGEVEAEAIKLLSLDVEALWSGRCWREVQESGAPIHDLRDGHGLLFLRWLLHQVLPYPCFLSGIHWVAARLRIKLEDLQAVIEDGKSELALDLEGRKYSGILAAFAGDRWWRGALEDYAWELTGANAGDSEVLHQELQKRAGRTLQRVEEVAPVVCLTAEFQPTSEFGSPATALRVRPDHWPAFADAAWMDIDTVRSDPALAAMVDPLERGRIFDEDDE